MLAPLKGFLVEYALAVAAPPLMLAFDFNPQRLTRSRRLPGGGKAKCYTVRAALLS